MRTVEEAKIATVWAFALAGAAFATWAGRIPDIRTALDLTPGQLGVLLLCGAVGSLLSLPLAGGVASRIGTEAAVRVGGAATLLGLLGAGLTAGIWHSYWATAGCLFFTSAGIGLWDVAMNLEGASVERLLGRTIMPRFHAAFSAGTVVSALVAAGLVALGVPLVRHFVTAMALVAVALWWTSANFLPRAWEEARPEDIWATAADSRPTSAESEPIESVPDPSDPASTDPARSGLSTDPTETRPPEPPPAPRPAVSAAGAWREPRTLLIGIVMLVAAFTEGTANDWLSVAFIDGHELPGWAGVLAFAVFLLCMTLGRMVGGAMLDRWGRVPVLRAMLLAAGAGSLAVVIGDPPLAYLGAAVWGFGIALGFPVGMSAAADDARSAAARVSVVSTIAYGAFLLGPPLLGFLGDRWGVLRALTAVAALLIPAILALPALRPPDST